VKKRERDGLHFILALGLVGGDDQALQGSDI
jgi:hypothetical protein